MMKNKKKRMLVTGALCFFLVSFALIGPVMSDVEKPEYEVLSSNNFIEMRKYAPMIIAEVEVKGTRDQAIGNGFRILADYIFGNNIAQKSIAMTAPVQQQNHEKIAMTAPVQQQSDGDMWKVSFVMPSAYDLDTLPQPKNKKVKLKHIATKHFLAIRFSGTNSDRNVEAHQDKLMLYVQDHKFKTTGTPKYAFYNPPWTLPFMRRNEVMIEVDVSKDRGL